MKVILRKVHYFLISCLYHRSPRLLVTLKVFKKIHVFPNLKEPKTYTKKNQWMKFHHITPLMKQVADKLGLKAYLQTKNLSDLCVPIIAVVDTLDALDFNSIEYPIILKMNHGSGMNKILYAKEAVTPAIRRLFKFYAQIRYHHYNHERVYEDIQARIIVEPYHGPLIDYKIMCVNQKILYTVALKRYPDGHYDEGFYEADWKTSLCGFKHIIVLDPKIIPKQRDRMNEIALLISKDFLQVRVDFYEINDALYISELTFFSESGILAFDSPEMDRKLGDQFILPNA